MLQCTSPLSASTFGPCETQLPQRRDHGLSLDTPFLVVSTMLERSRCSISICGMQTPGMWHQPGWHFKNRFSYSVSDWGLGIKQQPAIGPVEDEAGGVGSSVEGCWRSGSIRSRLVRAAGPRPGWLWISREPLGSPGNQCLGCLPWPQSEISNPGRQQQKAGQGALRAGMKKPELTCRPQETYQTVGVCCARLAQHRIAVLRKKLGDFGYSCWEMHWSALICYGSCVIGRDHFRIVSDSMEGIQRQSCAGDSGFIHITDSVLWRRVGLTFNKKKKSICQYMQIDNSELLYLK